MSMSKIPLFFRTTSLALLVASQLSLAGFSQTLAYVQQPKWSFHHRSGHNAAENRAA